mgnify:CR=1 FL=1
MKSLEKEQVNQNFIYWFLLFLLYDRMTKICNCGIYLHFTHIRNSHERDVYLQMQYIGHIYQYQIKDNQKILSKSPILSINIFLTGWDRKQNMVKWAFPICCITSLYACTLWKLHIIGPRFYGVYPQNIHDCCTKLS